ncbi:MAG: hypothetical protein JNK70_03205 [Phycisphaerae bacterium]|nr:hypothetical protein [Phycisphaerae bacterium]
MMVMRRKGSGAWGVIVLAGMGILLAGAGCSIPFSSRPIETRSVHSPVGLTLVPGIRAYRSADKNTADVYLTDLPRSACEPGASIEGLSGQVLHLHLFISPEAGSTPIDRTACSVMVRLVVLSRGEVGLYGGGGFLQPSSDPGSRSFDGTIRGATLRLIASTRNFKDLLGACELSGTISAPRDEAASGVLEVRLNELMRAARQ